VRLDPRSTVRLILSGAAVLWATALPLAVYAAHRSDATPSASSIFALTVYQVGSSVCHQRPERSFHLASRPMPVCARCTGIYAGAAIAAVVATMWLRIPRSIPLKPDPTQATNTTTLPTPGARTVLVAAAMPALVTLLYEWTSGDAPSNEVRATTGLILGAGVAWILLRLE
jgi:uncharacterized membrane protein